MPSKMTKDERAAYMRDYRARQRRETIMDTTMPAQAVRELVECQDERRALVTEIARLKRELARRSLPDFVSGPVTVTSSTALLPAADAALAKFNRKTKGA